MLAAVIGQGRFDRLSPRARWRFQHYVAGVVVLPSMALSVHFQAWPSIATNVIILTFCFLGDAASRQAFHLGHHRGVLDSLEAMRHSESPEEYGRLVSSPRVPWRDGHRPPGQPPSGPGDLA